MQAQLAELMALPPAEVLLLAMFSKKDGEDGDVPAPDATANAAAVEGLMQMFPRGDVTMH